MASLKQQRSSAFSGCDSVRISPGVSLGTRIAQSFGIPKTAEKLGFFRLQLCENLFLRVFHVELKYSAIIWHPWNSNSREGWSFKAATLWEFISPGVSLGTKIAQSFGTPETVEKLGFFKLRLCENLFIQVIKLRILAFHTVVLVIKWFRVQFGINKHE